MRERFGDRPARSRSKTGDNVDLRIRWTRTIADPSSRPDGAKAKKSAPVSRDCFVRARPVSVFARSRPAWSFQVPALSPAPAELERYSYDFFSSNLREFLNKKIVLRAEMRHATIGKKQAFFVIANPGLQRWPIRLQSISDPIDPGLIQIPTQPWSCVCRWRGVLETRLATDQRLA